MINKTGNILLLIIFKVFTMNTYYGLKSTNVSLSITPGLSPGLLNVLGNRALAQNSSLLLIPDTQLISSITNN